MQSTKDKIKQNLQIISQEVEPYKAKIVGVTKYYGLDVMQYAYEAGLRDFGENKAIDAINKINCLEEKIRKDSTFHFIGHLQSNKAKKVVGFFDYIHSVDSLNLAQQIAKIADSKGIIQKVFIQVNNAFEEQKFGIAPSQLNNLLNEIQKMKSVEVVGLMNMAPFTDDENEIHRLFREMYKLKEEYQLKELSMGMSDDYDIAVQQGATFVRVGTALFGARDYSK